MAHGSATILLTIPPFSRQISKSCLRSSFITYPLHQFHQCRRENHSNLLHWIEVRVQVVLWVDLFPRFLLTQSSFKQYFNLPYFLSPPISKSPSFQSLHFVKVDKTTKWSILFLDLLSFRNFIVARSAFTWLLTCTRQQEWKLKLKLLSKIH